MTEIDDPCARCQTEIDASLQHSAEPLPPEEQNHLAECETCSGYLGDRLLRAQVPESDLSAPVSNMSSFIRTLPGSIESTGLLRWCLRGPKYWSLRLGVVLQIALVLGLFFYERASVPQDNPWLSLYNEPINRFPPISATDSQKGFGAIIASPSGDQLLTRLAVATDRLPVAKLGEWQRRPGSRLSAKAWSDIWFNPAHVVNTRRENEEVAFASPSFELFDQTLDHLQKHPDGVFGKGVLQRIFFQSFFMKTMPDRLYERVRHLDFLHLDAGPAFKIEMILLSGAGKPRVPESRERAADIRAHVWGLLWRNVYQHGWTFTRSFLAFESVRDLSRLDGFDLYTTRVPGSDPVGELAELALWSELARAQRHGEPRAALSLLGQAHWRAAIARMLLYKMALFGPGIGVGILLWMTLLTVSRRRRLNQICSFPGSRMLLGGFAAVALGELCLILLHLRAYLDIILYRFCTASGIRAFYPQICTLYLPVDSEECRLPEGLKPAGLLFALVAIVLVALVLRWGALKLSGQLRTAGLFVHLSPVLIAGVALPFSIASDLWLVLAGITAALALCGYALHRWALGSRGESPILVHIAFSSLLVFFISLIFRQVPTSLACYRGLPALHAAVVALELIFLPLWAGFLVATAPAERWCATGATLAAGLSGIGLIVLRYLPLFLAWAPKGGMLGYGIALAATGVADRNFLSLTWIGVALIALPLVSLQLGVLLAPDGAWAYASSPDEKPVVEGSLLNTSRFYWFTLLSTALLLGAVSLWMLNGLKA